MGPSELVSGSSKLVQKRFRPSGVPGPHSVLLLRRCNKGLSPTKGQGPELSPEPDIALAPTDLEADQCLFFFLLRRSQFSALSRVWKMGQGEVGGVEDRISYFADCPSDLRDLT